MVYFIRITCFVYNNANVMKFNHILYNISPNTPPLGLLSVFEMERVVTIIITTVTRLYIWSQFRDSQQWWDGVTQVYGDNVRFMDHSAFGRYDILSQTWEITWRKLCKIDLANRETHTLYIFLLGRYCNGSGFWLTRSVGYIVCKKIVGERE